jgi:hypothetical protein
LQSGGDRDSGVGVSGQCNTGGRREEGYQAVRRKGDRVTAGPTPEQLSVSSGSPVASHGPLTLVLQS